MARLPTVSIDFDGTICKNAWPLVGDPNPGMIEAVRELKEISNPIIFSCRTAPMEIDMFTPRSPALVQAERDKITALLESCGLYDILIWDKPWKPLAAAYIDDRAVHYTGRHNGWEIALMRTKALIAKGNKI